MNNSKLVWNDAPGAGIALGSVSTAYFLIGQWMSGLHSPVLMGVLSLVLWAVKFGACLYLLRLFMKRFVEAHEGMGNTDSFAFGCAVALLSALLYSAVYLAWVKFIQPEFFEKSIQTALSAYSTMLDANSRDALEQMTPRLPMIAFFTNLVYCSLFGVAASAVFSRNIPSQNPFKDNN